MPCHTKPDFIPRKRTHRHPRWRFLFSWAEALYNPNNMNQERRNGIWASTCQVRRRYPGPLQGLSSAYSTKVCNLFLVRVRSTYIPVQRHIQCSNLSTTSECAIAFAILSRAYPDKRLSQLRLGEQPTSMGRHCSW